MIYVSQFLWQLKDYYIEISGRKGAQAYHHTQAQLWLSNTVVYVKFSFTNSTKILGLVKIS